jgi:hypothetical protein
MNTFTETKKKIKVNNIKTKSSMKLNLFILMAGIIVLAASCKPKNKTSENLAPNVHKITAEEVVQSSNYTYIRALEDNKESWLAISKREVAIGKSYYFVPNIEMTDFVSKELKRTFKTIVFVEKFSEEPIVPESLAAMPDSLRGIKPAVAKEGIKVEPAKGGITIGELFAKKDSYEGKTVKIKGEVVKFSPEIMGKNWLHIQDGTSGNGAFDLTITTGDVVKIGDIVTFEGVVALKKDFGAGYFYEVIVENGKLIP